jgi:APA family basic amino acid/polyamine antiporter
MAIAIMISGFGCCNGLILAGSRVYYAMAKDGLFFQSVAKLHPTYKTPAVSLMVQMVWTCILCVSGSYGQLLDYIIFRGAGVLHPDDCGIVRAAAHPPDAERPYRAFGYPICRHLYCDGFIYRCRTIALQTAVHLAGTDVVLLGIPVYFVWSRAR